MTRAPRGFGPSYKAPKNPSQYKKKEKKTFRSKSFGFFFSFRWTVPSVTLLFITTNRCLRSRKRKTCHQIPSFHDEKHFPIFPFDSKNPDFSLERHSNYRPTRGYRKSERKIPGRHDTRKNKRIVAREIATTTTTNLVIRPQRSSGSNGLSRFTIK